MKLIKGGGNMNKIKEILLSLMFSLLLISCFNSTNLYAMEKYNSSAEIEDRYWAGNPNPAPGSEAWLQQHYNFKPGNQAAMQRCFIQALGIQPSDFQNYAYVASLVAKRALSVGLVGNVYGGVVAFRYFQCAAGY